MTGERWLVTGASGQLGGHLVRHLAAEDSPGQVLPLAGRGATGAMPLEPARIDLRDIEALRACVRSFRPTHVFHVGAVTAVADAHAGPAEADRINSLATQELAAAAADVGARFVFSSTDMVFDGSSAPYREDDAPRPVSTYGRTKAEAEQRLAAFENALTVRLPLMYGFACTARETTFARQIAALRESLPLRLFTDEFRTPVWFEDAAAAMIALARSALTGLIHLAGPQRLSRYEMVARFAGLLEIPQPKLLPVSRLSINAPEPRPEDLSLDGSRFNRLFPRHVPGPIRAEVFDRSPP